MKCFDWRGTKALMKAVLTSTSVSLCCMILKLPQVLGADGSFGVSLHASSFGRERFSYEVRSPPLQK